MRCQLSNAIISIVFHDSFMPIVLEIEWLFCSSDLEKVICIFRFLSAVSLYFKDNCRSVFGRRCGEPSVKTSLSVCNVKNYKKTCISFINVSWLVTQRSDYILSIPWYPWIFIFSENFELFSFHGDKMHFQFVCILSSCF